MSTFAPRTLACPCGARVSADIADGLHISLRPDLRQQILDGTFHVFSCAACGGRMQVDKLLAYSDFPRRHWFTVVPERDLAYRASWARFCDQRFRDTMIERAAPLVRAWAPEMKRRLIFGLASLREKLMLFDEGLDDHAIEVVKLRLRRDLQLESPASYLFFTRRRSAAELVLTCSGLGGGAMVEELTVPLTLYEEALALGEEGLRGLLPEMDDLVVDHRVTLVPDLGEGAPELPSAVPAPVMGEPPGLQP